MSETRINVETFKQNLHAVAQPDFKHNMGTEGSCSENEPYALQVIDDSMEPEFAKGCVIVIDPTGKRVGKAQTIEVGEGPIGATLDEFRSRLYVLNRFEGTISAVSTTTELEISRASFHDATPEFINVGRRHLYDKR